MKQIIVLLGLFASASCGFVWGGDFGAPEAAGSSSLNRRNESHLVVYEGTNEDGEREEVTTPQASS